jgi:hypothetical protein
MTGRQSLGTKGVRMSCEWNRILILVNGRILLLVAIKLYVLLAEIPV